MSAGQHAASPPGGGPAEAYCGMCSRSFPVEQATCPHDGTKLVRFQAKTDPLIGRVLEGRYQIEAQIGEGGMGAVYRGRQLSIDREVAIKVVHPAIAANREVAKRFLREARVASSLNAPGIVAVFDFGQTDDGVLYLVMELIKGTSLDALVKRGPVEASRVAQIALQVCDAIEVAHAAGIVHRDLKPANIIIVDNPTGEVVKILDFGIAKVVDAPSMTMSHAMVGTPFYMAPEQFNGHSDARSDLYSLGCVLYELLDGKPPFTANDLGGLYMRHANEPPPPPHVDVPPDLWAILQGLLEKRPENRFASVNDLRVSLAGMHGLRISTPVIRTMITPAPFAARGQTATPTPMRAPTMPEAPARPRRMWLMPVALVAAAGVGAAVFMIVRPGERPASANHAAPTTPASGAELAPAPTSAQAPQPSPSAPVAAPAPIAAPADAGVAGPTPDEVQPEKTKATATKPTRGKRKTTPQQTKPKPTGETELPFAPTE